MIGINIEMPKNCSDCPFQKYHHEFGSSYAYCLFDKSAGDKLHRRLEDLVDMNATSRHHKCPLVELKGENNEN